MYTFNNIPVIVGFLAAFILISGVLLVWYSREYPPGKREIEKVTPKKVEPQTRPRKKIKVHRREKTHSSEQNQ